MESVILQEDFARLVNEYLIKKDWTRADLARAMGASRQMVTTYLNGHQSPGPDVIERFFNALDCDVRLVVTERSKLKSSRSSRETVASQ